MACKLMEYKLILDYLKHTAPAENWQRTKVNVFKIAPKAGEKRRSIKREKLSMMKENINE